MPARLFLQKPMREVPVWRTGDAGAARAQCRPWPEGRLAIEKADDMDWSEA
ncbi:hypothetical protein [Marimonas arenosa]|uniref:Uncharacterized protein n=1 Tax=Marimonas arenosa TaxID=1795305 RepID=A0AAE3WF15_9RHOB|nr:hypothetical protein [Marimonas arenosa]MDQ2091527.1 hypothetical protein [Marimonas arenosa]